MQPNRRGDVEGSPAWEKYAAAIDRLEEEVEDLIRDGKYLLESEDDKYARTDNIFELKKTATQLRDDILQDMMPGLSDRITAVLAKIDEALRLRIN